MGLGKILKSVVAKLPSLRPRVTGTPPFNPNHPQHPTRTVKPLAPPSGGELNPNDPTYDQQAPALQPTAVPTNQLDNDIESAQAAKLALIKRGEAHVSRGASALSYLFQGMAHFGNNLQGRPSDPVTPLGQQRYARELGQADKKLQPLLDTRQQQIDYQTSLSKGQQAQYGASSAQAKAVEDQLKAIQQQNPHFYDTLKNQGYVTHDQSVWAGQNGLGNIPEGDFRDYDHQTINGGDYATPKTGAPNWQRTNAPEDIMKAPMLEQTPGLNQPLPGLPNDISNRANRRYDANVIAGGKAAETNRIEDTKYRQGAADAKTLRENRLNKSVSTADEGNNILNESRALKSKAESYRAQAAKLRQKNETLDAEEKATKLEDKADKFEQDALEKKTKGDKALSNAVELAKDRDKTPVKPKAAKAPSLRPSSVKRIKQSDIDRIIHQ